MKDKIKALVLFSGGLDSRLVVKLLQEQGLELELLNFKLPFGCGCSAQGNEEFARENNLKLAIIDCTKSSLFKEYLDVIKHPRYGRGAGMNPCIDCKIFMFRKAKEYADSQKPKINIIATGEVLGERPMSQTSKALGIIDKEIGFELLRPLSAKLLPETQAEKKGLVDRNKLLGIQGRQRKLQIELAERYKIKYPSPGGGCLLCEEVYAARLKDIFEYEKSVTPEILSSLANFRHFRNPETGGKIILGRSEAENNLLEELNKKLAYNIIVPEEIPGPTALCEKKEDKELAEALIKAYSSKNLEERKKFENIKI